ncbi:MAG: efflux RND transporter periplasmic adaptor subunit [Gammaproteobacteria bacterium]|nr:efflux RND transporter periplasmic adaptor subunit [Gammaproteobacteria bacterium]
MDDEQQDAKYHIANIKKYFVSNRNQILIALGLICAIWLLWTYEQPSSSQFITAPVVKGDIVSIITATGTVNPVATVQVGTYVSGTIQNLYCDYNTKVKAGQLCAKIDPRPYQVVYDQALANLATAQAQLKKDFANFIYAQTNYNRDSRLLKKGIVSQDALDLDKSALDQAIAQNGVNAATIKQREATLAAAKVNLDYTNIISPVDGTVVSRSIDVGQTVAASFQTPTLFLIAKDLTQMQVDTNVSESDVGDAKVGQKATFTVEAYPDKTFIGKVTQVRQAPISVQNVVTYDVVISTSNRDFKLLPGMTANTRIITSEHNDVLLVPVQALRFSVGKQENKAGASDDPNQGHVYILHFGKPKLVPVTIGLSDGTNTEISGGDIQDGDQVIVNEIKPGEAVPGAPARSPLRF